MTRVDNYVVAYEATERGNEAIELGVALARLTAAELRLCLILPRSSAVPAKVPSSIADFDALLEEQGRLWLAGAAARVPADVTATTHLLWADSTSEGLIEAAKQFQSDRIVVGAARGGILNRFSIGSVANALLHASPVPVALAPHGYHAPEKLTRITCAIGTRPGWEALLDSLVALSNGLDVDLRFVTLIEVDAAHGRPAHPKPHPPHVPHDPAAHDQAGHDHGGADHAGAAVAGAAALHDSSAHAGSAAHLVAVLQYFRTRSTALGTVTTEVGTGTSVEAAVETLGWLPSEVVIVGSSRLARPSTIFLGITANRMLHGLPVPLIVVPNTHAHPAPPTRVPPTPAPPARTR
ncbi:universal stress protein [Cryobacterium melibiosiphilum]|uniref:Universal stress protein n=1 Tax=Cryobacterium melibiosiphilum TaxID=995039 RepID=A0A3A5MTM1_9MICO|nr:universal stress protein [Cryobacterium melibiosiphilum]RJT91179.1 universal stress protein [Cryobacterium melibiosiphilum]